MDDMPRAERVRVRAQDVDGNTFERDLDGMLAVCVQHEMDHLDGKLFVDYLSEMKRQRIRKKLDKERRERGSRRARTLRGSVSCSAAFQSLPPPNRIPLETACRVCGHARLSPGCRCPRWLRSTTCVA